MSQSGEHVANCFVAAIIIAIVGGLISLLVFVNSAQKEHVERVKTGYFLPDGATDIVPVGLEWQEFTYKGQRFLFHQNNWGEKGYECIVKIDIPENKAEAE